ncbi:MAG: hypothetical protein K6G54_00485 [Oscillospiraceae bacterium]|nr:hypothetical protein [Oscillospiraceae bacterium]
MLFSEGEIDLLSLLKWCQFAPRSDVLSAMPESVVNTLVLTGFIQTSGIADAFVLTAKGSRALDEADTGKFPSITQSYHTNSIERRLRLARLMLTAYRAGVNVFTTEASELISAPSLFLSALARGRGSDPWGSTRVGALIHLPGIVAAMHYVSPGIGKISLVDEIGVLVNQTAAIKDVDRAFFFAGTSYTDILKELGAGVVSTGKLITYGEACRTSPYPIFLLSCNETGAKQLRLMSVPKYREWFTRATLRSEFRPPPADVPDWDALFRGAPFVMAADMDLRRIDRACAKARKNGYDSVSMAALEPQAKEVLYPRYVDTGMAKVFVWTPETEAALFGEQLKLYSIGTAPYRNAKGAYAYAPIIEANRKSGRPAGTKARKLV